jgi:hypothetical protein
MKIQVQVPDAVAEVLMEMSKLNDMNIKTLGGMLLSKGLDIYLVQLKEKGLIKDMEKEYNDEPK